MDTVQIIFEAQTPYGMYRDALYFQEGEVPPEAEIERLKQERINTWVSIVAAMHIAARSQSNEVVAGNYTDA
jgi:hypothetical protein